ncbi:head-tail adaptor protein [Rhodobacterales bacterium HKCCE2091]|nr:head-tail adaptor protein [Rhodobacterales bacterium HKCCE2091]
MTGVKLDRLLTLEDPGRAADGAGGFVETWTALGTLWAQVVPRSGREAADGSVVRYRIVVRDSPPGSPARPLPQQRFSEGGRVFHIEAVTEAPGLDRHLLCYAYEETAA